MKNESPIYSYYYPLTTSCNTLQQRSLANGGVMPTDETILCQKAKPLFVSHRQPNIYILLMDRLSLVCGTIWSQELCRLK